MTRRAILIGIFLALLVGAFAFVNDMVLRQNFLFSSYLPICVYGVLLLWVCLIHPLLRHYIPWMALHGKELALMLIIILPMTYVGSRALIHHFPAVLMFPRIFNQTYPGWQKWYLIRRLPPNMIPEVSPLFEEEDIRNVDRLIQRLLNPDPNQLIEQQITQLVLSIEPHLTPANIVSVLNRFIQQSIPFFRNPPEEYTLPVHAKALLTPQFFRPSEEWRFNRYIFEDVYRYLTISLVEKEAYAYDNFWGGIPSDSRFLPLSRIPWKAWLGTLVRFWIPFLVFMVIGFLGLSLVVRRRWTEHEHIPFPIAKFVLQILPADVDGIPPVFKYRSFWIAMGTISAIYLYNYLGVWWPKYLVSIPLSFDFRALGDFFPLFQRGGGIDLLRPTFFFSVVGFAFLVANDVSLSIGLAPFVYTIVAGFLATYFQISLSDGGDYNSLRLNNFIKIGSYFAMLLIIIYTGRHYFKSVFLSALGIRTKVSEIECMPDEVWGMRVFGIALLMTTICLMTVGIAWYWALFQMIIVFMTYTVVSRMVGETGMFLFHPMIVPVILLWAFLGPQFIGTDQMLYLLFLSGVIDFGAHISVMPMFLHGQVIFSGTLSNLEKEHLPRWNWQCLKIVGGTFLGTLLLAIGTAIFFQYSYGANATCDAWAPRLTIATFEVITEIEQKLSAYQIDFSVAREGIQSLGTISLHKGAVVTLLITITLVILTEYCRLRIPNWPIHPVLFLVAGFWHARVLAFSFLFGWVLKGLITKYGGSKAYRSTQPLMIGLVTGELLAATITFMVGLIYYLWTGQLPPRFYIFPG